MVQADRRRATGAVIGLEQAPRAVRDLEGLPGTARDDGEVVRGVAASREFPVDDAMRRIAVGVEEDVLAKGIAVQQSSRLGWWQVLGRPGKGVPRSGTSRVASAASAARPWSCRVRGPANAGGSAAASIRWMAAAISPTTTQGQTLG